VERRTALVSYVLAFIKSVFRVKVILTASNCHGASRWVVDLVALHSLGLFDVAPFLQTDTDTDTVARTVTDQKEKKIPLFRAKIHMGIFIFATVS